MRIFAIESSCDETAAAILEAEEATDGHRLRLLSNVVATQIPIHALYGGVVPEIASRAHAESISGVVRQAFADAGLTPADVDAVAVTYAPGLIGSLLVGVSFAKAFAYANGLPLSPVNHIEGHVAAAYLANPGLKPPFLALVVSGGHTSLYEVTDYTTFHEIGATRDDACGEAFDKVGRVMGLPYPGGAAMDRLATEGFAAYDPHTKGALRFPSPATPDDTLDFSFSGLKTAVINHIHTTKQRMFPDEGDDAVLPDEIRAEIAAAFTTAVTEGIAKKLDMALRTGAYRSVVMAGGVAANSHLRRAVGDVCGKHGVSFTVPPLSLCGDNGAMIAVCGYHLHRLGIHADTTLNAYANLEE